MIEIVTAGFLIMLGVTAVMALAAVGTRLWRRLRDRRRATVVAGQRRLLLEFAAGEGDPDELVAMPDRIWRAIEPSAIDLLVKIRGEAQEALAVVFERRGAAERAMRDLDRRGLVRRARAVELLGTLGRTEAVPKLCVLLDERNPDLRVVVVRSLGRLGDPTAAAPLLRSLTGSRPTPSHLVAHALAQLGPEATGALKAALDHVDAQVRLTAVEALGLRGVTSTQAKLADLVTHDESVVVRTRAAAMLGRVGTRTSVDALLQATDVVQPTALRAQAARALGELSVKPAVGVLAHLVTDPQYEVAHQASRALLRLGSAGEHALNAIRTSAGSRHGRNSTEDRDRARAHATEALAAHDLGARRASRTAHVG